MSALPLRQPGSRRHRHPRARRHLRAVPEPRTRHTLLFALLFLLVGGALVFAAVTLNALATRDAVAARALEEQVTAQQRAYSRLVAEVAALEDPGRLRRIATQELGMVPAGSPRYLLLDRHLPGDGRERSVVRAGATADPLKPVLSVER